MARLSLQIVGILSAEFYLINSILTRTWSWLSPSNLFNKVKKDVTPYAQAKTTPSVKWQQEKYNDYAQKHPNRLQQLTTSFNNTERPSNIYVLYLREKLRRNVDPTAEKAFYAIFKRHTFLGSGSTTDQEGLKLDEQGNMAIKN